MLSCCPINVLGRPQAPDSGRKPGRAEAAHLDQQLDAGADGTKCRNLISRRRRPRCRGKPTRSTPSTKWIVAGTSGVVALSPDSTQRVPVVEESAVAVEERKKKERGVELAADK